ncbi:hypothetical protein [Asticcacaulis machinosus]|uniref:Glycosyltransferase RgtA/B/C/D-like domain-containing protein n=1 Tax=Asticcacaulis machinosus TaxID=2984211 RepID=A0ABT5HK88_9CAUL|nr:hypothetical protein [Asticcacaulis machinosus]MDC7676556.1 hypothetical protein [Asticcacaulis machinosus]
MTSDLTPVAPKSASTALIIRVLAFNLPLVFGLLSLNVLPEVLQPFFAGLMMMILPGLAWSDMRGRDFVVLLFRVVIISILASAAVWLLLMPLPGPTSRIAFVVGLALIVNAGLWFGTKRQWFDLTEIVKPLPAVLLAVAALFYLQSFMGATKFVPQLEDQDMELQATAYGMINDGTPNMVTNRGTRFYLAHPLMLHFWIGEGALFEDEIDGFKYYYDASVAAKDPNFDRQAAWDQSFVQFNATPLLLATRTPNIFLSFLIIFPLGFLVHRLSGSLIAAAGAGVFYATFPEIYVRSSYGGYMAISNFWLVCSAYFYLRATGLFTHAPAVTDPVDSDRRRGFWASFMSSISDQKGALLPMAVPVHVGLRFLMDGGLKGLFDGGIKGAWDKLMARPDVRAGLAVCLGFLGGWMAFIVYGFIVDPHEFYEEHIYDHLIGRLKAAEDKVVSDWVYPSAGELWMQFITHYGWLTMIAFGLALIYGGRRIREGVGFLVLWFAIGAIGFSLVDWRQTKHFAHFVPALVMLTAVYWASLKGRWQQAFTAFMVVTIVWNFYRVILTMQNFTYIQPLPIW